LLVADNNLGSVGRPSCQVDHLAPRVGVDAEADKTRCAYPQACFLLDLAYCCVGRVFPGLDLARNERPGGLPSVRLTTYGTGPDGRLFRSETGNPLQPSSWWQVRQKVRAASLTPNSSPHR
jgi:hypothetical protein